MDQPVVSWGAPPAERADAARNRRHLLAVAREMLAEQGPDKLTMEIARAALDGHQPIPAGSQSPLSQMHIRMLLRQMSLDAADLNMLAVQLTAALDGPRGSTSPPPTSLPPPSPPNGSREAGRTWYCVYADLDLLAPGHGQGDRA